MDAVQLMPHALEHLVAFVPNSALHAGPGDARAMRLSFECPR